MNLSLAINYAMGELEPFGYHVFNLTVHLLCALLLFGIVSRTLRRQRIFGDKGPVDAVALACALVWMVHPLLSETIDYTTERTESMMGLFFLLTLYAAIRARDRKRAGKWTAIAIGSCALGMATKESMAVAPIAVVLYDAIFEFDSTKDALASRRTLYIGLAATWVELGAIMWRWPRSTVGAATVGPITYLENQAQMIARYLWLTVWPRSLVVDYGLPQQIHIGDIIPQGILILALIGATIVALVRWPAAGFLGAMFFLTLAPTSSVVPILSEVGAERRMYLPLAAIVVLVVASVPYVVSAFRRTVGIGPPKGGHYVLILVVVVGALGVRTVERNRDYDSALALWQTDVDRRPHGRSRFALANQLLDASRQDEAIVQLRLAAVDFPDARAGLGTALLVQGHLEEGISVLESFVAAAPSLPNRAPARMLLAQAHRALAERALSQQNAALAAEEAGKSVALDGTNADAHNILGAALASEGNIAAAIPEFQAAVRINPQHPSAVNNLARALAMGARTGRTP